MATLVLCDTSDGLNRTFTPAQREEFIRLRIGPLLAGKAPRDMAPTVADTLIGRQSSRAAWQRLVDSMAAAPKALAPTVHLSLRKAEVEGLGGSRWIDHRR